MRQLILTLVSAILVFGSGDQVRLTADQWREDIRFLAQELPKRHKNAFHTLSREEFERRVRALTDQASNASDLEMKAGIVRLMAAIGDTETGGWIPTDRLFAFRVREFPEGIYFTAAPAEYRNVVGARIVALNGVEIDEVRRRLLPLASAPDEVSRRTALEPWLRNAQALHAVRYSAKYFRLADAHSTSPGGAIIVRWCLSRIQSGTYISGCWGKAFPRPVVARVKFEVVAPVP